MRERVLVAGAGPVGLVLAVASYFWGRATFRAWMGSR